ncbi:hypothetical protein BTR14_03810 [Rhizobium rhizosphaerae]|uniref:DUF1285 domain-containing protein n=1 Tax=Xaviernesmea rhizosphaerae TaxID=1672749 RepID=A0ABX3PGP7_9HYPH|nr:hypothetical protein BTR14_03810 [Xaviernesmea rhizosphaerae]
MAEAERNDSAAAAGTKGPSPAMDGLSGLIARASEESGGRGKGPPPVERWNPPFCGEIDMEIRADGSWWYLGTPIGRAPLVRLFSTVLRKDEDGVTYLVTPVEKLQIRVTDAHFLAVEMHAEGSGEAQSLTFRTQVGDVVTAGPDHILRFTIDPGTQALKPYLHVRGRLEALLSRAVTHELMALGEEIEIDGVPVFALRSQGAVFPVLRMAELEASGLDASGLDSRTA